MWFYFYFIYFLLIIEYEINLEGKKKAGKPHFRCGNLILNRYRADVELWRMMNIITQQLTSKLKLIIFFKQILSGA